MLPKGILFDLDDTIIAFGAVSDPVWQHLCDIYAARAGKCSPAGLLQSVRETSSWYWSDAARHKHGRHNLEQTRREIVRMSFEGLGIKNSALAHEMADTYSVQRDAAIRCFPLARETLKYFNDQGVSLALVTNGSAEKQRQKIERFGLRRYFSAILIEGELGYGKPEEPVYLRAMEEVGLCAGDVWMVGDNLEWDVAAPQKLGIFSIWNDFQGQGLPPGSTIVPDRIVNSIAELMG